LKPDSDWLADGRRSWIVPKLGCDSCLYDSDLLPRRLVDVTTHALLARFGVYHLVGFRAS
jgi:hypothetical protein